MTTAARSEALPDVPAVSEFVPSYEASAWYGIGVPRNTPAEIIDKLNKEINAALDPKLKARLADLGGAGASRFARQFRQTQKRDGQNLNGDRDRTAGHARYSR